MVAFMYMYEFKVYENEAIHPFKPNPELFVTVQTSGSLVLMMANTALIQSEMGFFF